MDKILVSACLLGEKTKYDGGDNLVEGLNGLLEFYELVPFCPEVEGGLPIPRVPSERKGNWVKNKEGADVTSEFALGAEKALRLCKTFGITMAILKQGSPSCGSKEIYDGFFRNKKIAGQGVTAALLAKNGIRVMDEEEGLALLQRRLERKQAREEAVAKVKEKEAERESKAKEQSKRRFAKPRRGGYAKTDARPPRKRTFRKDGDAAAPEKKFDGEGKPQRKPYGKKPFGKKPFGKKPLGRKPYAGKRAPKDKE